MKGNKFVHALIWPFAAMLVVAVLLFVQQAGVTYGSAAQGGFLPAVAVVHDKPQSQPDCLIVWDKTAGDASLQEIAFTLKSMGVGYDLCDVSSSGKPCNPDSYQVVILALSRLDKLGSSLLDLFDWVKRGGRLMLAYAPSPSPEFSAICPKLGILNPDGLYYEGQYKVQIATDLLCGGKGLTLEWSHGERQGLVVQLADDCLVHIWSLDEENNRVPMLWQRKIDSGLVVVCNGDAFAARVSRGLIASAYSLMQDEFAWPVINASMFFIDDFPAPIPGGRNACIDKFYGTDIESFYSQVWFPDILALQKKYGLKYTGMLVETYNDKTSQPFERGTASERYRYFGGVLLQKGGEIGLHGYNHQPLVLPSYDYQGLYSEYHKWPSTDDMAQSLTEALDFARNAFPGITLKTYVPPSNVLSTEARAMLHEKFPSINTISIVYLNDNLIDQEEFDVGEDGIVDLPRILSGCIFNDDIRWLALSEVNFHYVNSHFLHPDDAMDPERGGNIGWKTLSQNFDGYLGWLYGSAKDLRSMTAQQGAAAVQRYCNISVTRSEQPGKYVLDLGGFYDEAYLLVRLNTAAPGAVTGGTLENVCGDLYLLHATAAHVEIGLKGGVQ